MWKLEKFVQDEHIASWDEEFVLRVYKDIDGFLNEKPDRCVLIFPPLSNRRRYLVHKLGELFNVQTFSVGEGFRRLTVVCASEKVEKQVDEEKKVMDTIDSKKGAISKAKRAARPSAPIYIPPAIRRVQKAQLPDKNDKLQPATKQSNRQKDNKKPTNNVNEMCNIIQTPQKSEIVDVNMKSDSSELRTSQLVNVKEIEFESNAPASNINTSKSESNVPDRNVINLTFENETSTIIHNFETQSDVSGQRVPLNSQNITKSQKDDKEIFTESQKDIKEIFTESQESINEIFTESQEINEIFTESQEINEIFTESQKPTREIFIENQENITQNISDNIDVKINIEFKLENPDNNQTPNGHNKAVNNGTEIYENKNNLGKNNVQMHELFCVTEENNKNQIANDDKAVNNEIDNKELSENKSNKDQEQELFHANEETSIIQTSNDDNKAVNNGMDKKELWEIKNNNKDNDQEQQELLRASEEINRRNKRIIKQSFNNSDILIISNENKSDKTKSNNQNGNISQSNEKEAPVDCWEDLLDGGKLDSDLMLEIIDQVGNVNINTAKEDYSEYKQKTSLEGDYAHVLEIYDFPKDFTTRDLVSIIDSHKNGTYHIKWVDDNHALGVFSSGFVATTMLKISHPLIKLRPMTEASKQSIDKAIRYPNAMLPSAVRPPTCATAARRMVTGALGLKLINAKEERAKEIQILREAREKKRLSARQQDDAWEGKTSSN